MLSPLSCFQSDNITCPVILETLPKDIIDTLFAILPITTKRNFIRCNRELNLKKGTMEIYENNFMAKIYKFYTQYLPTNLSKIEKYTLEMIYDNCEHLIPTRYICGHNALCNKSPFMYFYCARSDNLPLLEILLNYNSTKGIFITYGAAFGGHLDVLKWARENGCEWDSDTCSDAALNGHLSVLKWARKNGC